MYHLSLVLLLAVPLAYSHPAGQHPVMVMMMVPEQHMYDTNAVNGMMVQRMNSATMQKMMAERREGMMQQQQQQQQQEQQQQEVMEQVEMMRQVAESRVSTKEMATESNVAMLEEIMTKMAAMLESMKAMSSQGQATEQTVESSNGVMGAQMTSGMTSGMRQQMSGMMDEMTRLMTTSGGSEQQMPAGSDSQSDKGTPAMQMTGGCTHMGMFLPVQGDSCQFMQCTFGAEIEAGVYSVVPTMMACSPGTAVAEGYAGGYDSPCTVESTTCGMSAPVKSTSNQAPRGYRD